MNFYERNSFIARNERLDPPRYLEWDEEEEQTYVCGYCQEFPVKHKWQACPICEKDIKEMGL